jgi:hypothetical protein
MVDLGLGVITPTDRQPRAEAEGGPEGAAGTEAEAESGTTRDEGTEPPVRAVDTPS